MTVYVITSGDYSDYCIVDVTLDRDIAEALLKIHPGSEIEEYEAVDDKKVIADTKDYIKSWDVIFKKDGSYTIFDTGYAEKHFEPIIIESPYYAGGLRLQVSVCNNDREKAIKIAQDARAKYLAKEFGLSLN